MNDYLLSRGVSSIYNPFLDFSNAFFRGECNIITPYVEEKHYQLLRKNKFLTVDNI